MSKDKIAFVITKPLQLMVALCLIKNKLSDSSNITIYVTNSFSDAKLVTLRASGIFDGNMVFEFLEDKNSFYYKVIKNKYSQVFLDSDVGFQTFIHLIILKIFNPFLKVNIYEEGYGTYSRNLYTGLKKCLLNFLFINTSYGKNFITYKVYLFNPDKYINEIGGSNKIIKINSTIWSFIEENHEYLDFIFNTIKVNNLRVKSNTCCVYLTSWHIDKSFINRFSKIDCDLYIKPHPHIDKKINFEGLFVLNGSTPFELIIFKLLDVYETIRVYDHGSAARLYVENPRVEFYSIE